jgi:short-subunit dehydrogenase
LALVARREDKLQALADELGRSDRAEVIAADLGGPEDRDQIDARLKELRVNVDVLVNSAGCGVSKPFAEADREHGSSRSGCWSRLSST